MVFASFFLRYFWPFSWIFLYEQFFNGLFHPCVFLFINFCFLLFLQANKMGLPSFFCHNGVGDPLATPPPAHCGIPPYQLDPKTMGKFNISDYLDSFSMCVDGQTRLMCFQLDAFSQLFFSSEWIFAARHIIRTTFDLKKKLCIKISNLRNTNYHVDTHIECTLFAWNIKKKFLSRIQQCKLCIRLLTHTEY